MENKATWWQKIRVWFHDSETIAWARLQVFFAILFEILNTVDFSPLTPFLPPEIVKWLPLILALNGIITEITRRLREPHDLNVKTAADLGQVMVPVKTTDTVVVDQVTNTVTIAKDTPDITKELPKDVQEVAVVKS